MSYVRRAREGDAEAMVILHSAAAPGAGLDAARRRARADAAAGEDRAGFIGWLGDRDPGSIPDGFATVERRGDIPGCEPGAAALLSALYVAPGARRSGLGRALTEAGAHWAATRGCRTLVCLAAGDAAPVHPALGALGLERRNSFTVLVRPLPEREAPLALPAGAPRGGVTPAPPVAGVPVSAAPARRPAWAVHALAAVAGAWALLSADVWSPDPWRGAIAPLVAAAAVVYFIVVFIVRRYSGRTRAEARAGDLFRIDPAPRGPGIRRDRD